MENISYNFEDAPENFVKCLATGCTAADKCLRCRAAQALMQKNQKLLVASPAFINPEAGEGCRMYQPLRTVRIAYGFKRALNSMRRDKSKSAAVILKSFYGDRKYYRKLNGEQAIDEAEQRKVINVSISREAEQPITFDSYKEVLKWI